MSDEQIYTVDLEIAQVHRSELLDFIQENYLRIKKKTSAKSLRKTGKIMIHFHLRFQNQIMIGR